jgi:hypothetical protein
VEGVIFFHQLFFIPSHEQFEWIIFEKFGHQEILKYDVFWAGRSITTVVAASQFLSITSQALVNVAFSLSVTVGMSVVLLDVSFVSAAFGDDTIDVL